MEFRRVLFRSEPVRFEDNLTMELVARKADLVRELQFFQQIVERKNTIPILANVLLESNGNEVTLLATDLEVALKSRCAEARSEERRVGKGWCRRGGSRGRTEE